jgi:hypothetical protein
VCAAGPLVYRKRLADCPLCICPRRRSAPRIIDNTVVLGVDLAGRIKATFPALFETSMAPKPKKKLSEPKVREVGITPCGLASALSLMQA